MKLNPNSIQPQISKHEVVHKSEVTRDLYDHPWHQHVRNLDQNKLNKPNPPSQEAVEKAKFKDKTFHWDSGVRSGNKRTSK
mgnify:CR=1 FL=1